METEISPIQLVLALPSLVCLIIAWVAMFQQGKTGLGVACILLTFLCGIGGLITFICVVISQPQVALTAAGSSRTIEWFDVVVGIG